MERPFGPTRLWAEPDINQISSGIEFMLISYGHITITIIIHGPAFIVRI